MKVLLAVDSSEASEAAVNSVRSRAWPQGSVIRVLSVTQPMHPPPPPAASMIFGESPYQDMSMPAVQQRLREHARSIAERVAANLHETGCDVQPVEQPGDPRAVIVDQAEEWKADLIVLGSHGRTGLRRWILGSVAEAVVRHAPCSVEVARARVEAHASAAPA